MALSESASLSYESEEPKSPLRIEESLKDQPSSPFNKQNSIFSLTLDEIQHKSGKSFGSMNMDEFLTNLWNNNVEENQISWQKQNDQQQQQQQPMDYDNTNLIIQTEKQTAPCNMIRQNSFSIPIQISKKTVEEVWSEIRKDQPQYPNNVVSAREPTMTFGKMTLEEFLIKAGVVQETIPKTMTTSMTANSLSHQQKMEQQPIPMDHHNTCLDANFGMGPNPKMAFGFSTHQNAGNNLLFNGYGAYPIYTKTKFIGVDGNIAEIDKSHGVLETTAGAGIKTNRKRIIDRPPEVVVERRQLRMIKNRESAARSRARKQACTVELELELTQLKEENEKLKQAVKELEQKRAQEILKRIEKSKMGRKKGEKLKTLRTSSSIW